jgi:hypothetical protein
MTAYEIGQRVQEYIRGALPLFEPMEANYNGELCEETFNCMYDAGGFGSIYDVPESLRGGDVDYRFRSPLHDMIEQQKGQKFIELGQMLAQAAALDKNVYSVVDTITAFRDAISGIGVPTKWTRSETTVREMTKASDAQKQAQASMGQMAAGADVVATLAAAQKDSAAAQPALAA